MDKDYGLIESILNSSDAGIIVCDLETGSILYVTKNIDDYFKDLNVKEYTGRSCQELFADAAYDSGIRILEKISSGKEYEIVEYFEKRKRCKTGVFFPKHMKSWWHRLWRPKSHPKINKDGWNLFLFWWDGEEMMVCVNYEMVLHLTNRGRADSYPQTEEDMTFRLILSMQYGKKWLRKPKKSECPLWMDVDYVRYAPR